MSRDWQAAFRRHQAPTSPDPIGLVVERAAGAWVETVDGRRYLDLLSGIGVANVGHTHPEVAAAVERQNRRHHHVMVYGEYVQEEQARYAGELAAATPAGLDCVYFVNSGAEAVEGALKTARKLTGRPGFAAFSGAYHGDTLGALSVAGNAVYQAPFGPLLGPVKVLPFGEVDSLAGIDETVAAVVVEPIQGEGGVRIPEPGFLSALSARCREAGALLVLDEVMTGFGRTGRMFACEEEGVTPDLLVLAKALGGGYPLGAFVGSRETLEVLAHDPPLSHVTTFGGHPVSCAAGRAALRVIRRDGLCRRASRMGEILLRRLRETMLPTGRFREIRGRGMFLGLEFHDPRLSRAFTDRCRERGVLLGWTLHHDHIVRLAPPLVLTEGDLEFGVSVMEEAGRKL